MSHVSNFNYQAKRLPSSKYKQSENVENVRAIIIPRKKVRIAGIFGVTAN